MGTMTLFEATLMERRMRALAAEEFSALRAWAPDQPKCVACRVEYAGKAYYGKVYEDGRIAERREEPFPW